MHGRIAMAPARLTGYGETPEGESYTIWCEGVVSQTMLYGEHLVLTRRISIEVGTSDIEVVDRVENLGFHPVPHLMLYHFNVGFPLLDENAELLVASQFAETESSPYKLASLYRQYPPAGPSADDEIVDLVEKVPGRTGPAAVMINRQLRGGMAIAIGFEPSTFPHLQIWRNMSDGMYALAIEPALQPFGKRDALEAAGLVGLLQPRECVLRRLRISAVAGAQAINNIQTKMTLA